MTERQQDARADGEQSGPGEQLRPRENAGVEPPRGGNETAGARGNSAPEDGRTRGPAGTGQGGGGGIAEVELEQLSGDGDATPEDDAVAEAKSNDAKPTGKPLGADLSGRRDGHRTEEELRRSGKQS